MFLIERDYRGKIKGDILESVIEDDKSILVIEELTAIDDADDYLAVRYDITKIFAEVYAFDVSATYNEGERVVFVADAWDNATNYAVDDLVSYKDGIYKALDTSLNILPTNEAKWEYIAENESMYSVLKESTGNLPTDTEFFKLGDTRNKKVVEVIVDILLYNIHSRLALQQVPQIRFDRYEAAMLWLKKTTTGEVNPDLPKKLDGDGNEKNTSEILYGSNEKRKLRY